MKRVVISDERKISQNCLNKNWWVSIVKIDKMNKNIVKKMNYKTILNGKKKFCFA